MERERGKGERVRATFKMGEQTCLHFNIHASTKSNGVVQPVLPTPPRVSSGYLQELHDRSSTTTVFHALKRAASKCLCVGAERNRLRGEVAGRPCVEAK